MHQKTHLKCPIVLYGNRHMVNFSCVAMREKHECMSIIGVLHTGESMGIACILMRNLMLFFSVKEKA